MNGSGTGPGTYAAPSRKARTGTHNHQEPNGHGRQGESELRHYTQNNSAYQHRLLPLQLLGLQSKSSLEDVRVRPFQNLVRPLLSLRFIHT